MKCICCQSNRIIAQIIALREYHKCLHCGFIFAPGKTDNNFKDILSSHYQNVDPHEQIAASKKSFFEFTLDYLAAEIEADTRSILDVGCGFGYFLESASQHGWDTYGVEITDAAVQGARRKIGEANIFHGFLREAYHSDECFDAITLWDVLVMVDSPSDELKECFRILKRRGKIGIRVRNMFFQKMTYKIYFPFRTVASWLNIKRPYVFHRYNFTAKSLYLLLQQLGFSRIQITNSPLTEGDPYSYTRIGKLTGFLKSSVDIVGRVLFQVSRGRLLTGPSLLVWAEKR